MAGGSTRSTGTTGPRATNPRSSRRGPTRGTAGALRGVAALVVLLALCTGIPWALLRLTSTSFPRGVPGPDELFDLLTRPDDGSLFLAVLTVAAWVGWATFAVAVAVEIPAQVRGAPAVRIRGLGVQQTVAGGLVTAALAVFLLPATAGAQERYAPGPPAASRSGVLATAVPGPSAHALQVPSSRRLVEPTHVVRPGDTLWDIAVAHLGDGSRWREIAALNEDRPQPDGSALGPGHVLRPGWRLVLPSVPAGAAPRRHVVRPGETLSGIARDELGDVDRFPELLAATEHVVQPDGRRLTDPDVLRPGWVVEIPGRPGRPRPPRTPSPAPPAHGRASRPAVSPAPDPALASSPPAVPPTPQDPLDPAWPGSVAADPASDGQPQAGRTSISAASSAATVPSTAIEPEDDLPEEVVDVRTAGGVGGLLAACLVVLVAARRTRQQRRRRPGGRIPLPARPALATEARLRAVADPAGVAHVDLALRALAARHRAAGRPLPGLRSARLTPTQLELSLTEAAHLPRPWVATSDPTLWAITHDDLLAQPETDMRAPYPSLVTIGYDLEDAAVLVDLEEITALAVEGDPDRTLPVLAAMAVELATSPWADDLLVTLVGCLPELPGTVATGRLRHVERVEQLIADLEGRALDVERLLDDAGVPDLAAARGTGVAEDAWSPEIVLLAGDVPLSVRERLEDVLYRVPRVGLAAVTAGGSEALGEWRLRIGGPDGTARLEPAGLTLRTQVLGGDEYAHVIEVLRVADTDPSDAVGAASALDRAEPHLADLPAPPAVPAPGSDTPGGDEQDSDPTGAADVIDEDVAAGDTSGDVVRLPGRPPFVRLLGPVEVVGARGPEPVTLKEGRALSSHVARATALVAFLSCRPEGANAEQIGQALSPVRRLEQTTVWSLASRARKWLGNDVDGTPYFPRTAAGGANRLHPSVRSDWAQWRELVGEDVAATPTERLLEALDLVRGRPFEGAVERHYTWAEPYRQEMLAAILDVVHEVVRRALLVPDGAAARRALRAGRRVDPMNERVWRDALRVEYVAGTKEGQRRLVEQIRALADELETDLEPETEQLIAELSRPAGQRGQPPVPPAAVGGGWEP